MNKLNTAKRAQILGMLVEGNSMRATSRMADCSINTVTKLLVDVGTAVLNTSMKHFVICLVSLSSVMKYGRSATRKKKCAGRS